MQDGGREAANGFECGEGREKGGVLVFLDRGLEEEGNPSFPPWQIARLRTGSVETSRNGVVGVEDLRLGFRPCTFYGRLRA